MPDQSNAESPKFVTTFTVTSQSGAKPTLEAITAAGFHIRVHPFIRARGLNISTGEAYETYLSEAPLSRSGVDKRAARPHGENMTKRMNNSKRWTVFCNAWLSIYCSAVADHNSRVSAEGHRETMRMLGVGQ